jgi:hypothetical protein
VVPSFFPLVDGAVAAAVGLVVEEAVALAVSAAEALAVAVQAATGKHSKADALPSGTCSNHQRKPVLVGSISQSFTTLSVRFL